MEDEEFKDSKSSVSVRTVGGKIINKLESGEKRDSNQLEQNPDPFAAEQTYLTEDDIKQAQGRKGSYDEMDQQMDETKVTADNLNTAFASKMEIPQNLEGMFDKMQIDVVGGKGDNDSDNMLDSDGSE